MGARHLLLLLPVAASHFAVVSQHLRTSCLTPCLRLSPAHSQVPKEYLHSAELRDIMQFGSSSQVGGWAAKHSASGLPTWACRTQPLGLMCRYAWRLPCPASLAHFCPQAVFFKMRVAGVLHIFQFETKQGEDICMALQVGSGAGVGVG